MPPRLTEADIQKIYGLLPVDDNDDLGRILDTFEILLKQPGAIVKPDIEVMKLADELVEGVPCH